MVGLLLLALQVAGLPNWEGAVQVAEQSVPRVEIQVGDSKGVCSSVVFDIDSEGVASALTAAHCVNHAPTVHMDLTVNGRNASVVSFNNLLDLAIIQFKPKHEVAIQLARVSPRAGTEVAVVGFAFGVEDMVAQFGRVAQTLNKETKTLWLNADLIFGDSGGALININGELVGINTRIYGQSVAHLGGAVPVEAVQDYVDDWRQKVEKEARKAKK